MSLIFKSTNEKSYPKHEVYYKGECIGNADFEWTNDDKYHVDFELNKTSGLANYSIEDVFNSQISSFTIKFNEKKYAGLDWANIDSIIWFEEKKTCYVNIIPDLLNWHKPINIIHLIDNLEQNLKENSQITFSRNENLLEEGIGFKVSINKNKNLNSECDRVLSLVENEINLIFEEFNDKSNKDSVVNVFHFPPEIQSSCEQYLIYFSNFLADLGINALTEIKSDAKNTLFTITPENKDEALSKIRDALNIYLNLPNANDLEIISQNYSDVSVHQLVANIYHLKSQLMMANSTLQLKNATIESLKITNYQINSLLRNNHNEEKTLDGLVTINEYKGKGFKINLPEIFRRLKRQFK